ncbi:tyrosine-type recombinase/integrase [Halorubrum trapanicum]|uniref:tyrosine-type recombinase/integrase n=1 Tax=Halorubrum trapanicum TaxID=29284 RepID=UPI003C70158E
MDLEPITPEEAVESYLEQRETEVAKATLDSHRSRLNYFTQWCNQEGIENLNELTGRLLHEYRLWRRNDGNLSKVSEKTQLVTLSVFIQWAESIEAVEQDLHIKVQTPSLAYGEDVRDDILETDQAEHILDYLSKFEYATRRHVVFKLLWHTMCRRGSIRTLDLNDYNPSNQYLEINHRPETGTPIKNQVRGERYIALSDDMCTLLDDWVETNRPDVTDNNGRSPLVATEQGRIHNTTIQQYAYCLTRPCILDTECPHGREIDECEAATWKRPFACPSSVSPHAIRRGSITHALNTGTPQEAVSDRANVTRDVLDKHYDARSKREKMEARRQFAEEL